MDHHTPILQLLRPELMLAGVACVLLLLGVSSRVRTRRLSAALALVTLAVVGYLQFVQEPLPSTAYDAWGTLHVFQFAHFIKTLSAGVGVILVLLAWPTDARATGNSGLAYGTEASEFFGLMLLSITGIFLVASANDIMLLFLGLELTSFPTYIMVSISRPTAAAQEAAVKYFFLGVLSAALMLLGFSYLYGTTGLTALDQITARLHPAGATAVNGWQMMALLLLIGSLAFKIAAVPMHVYAADVYQGAGTPVTAFLSFVPKTAGFVALIKVLAVAGGSSFVVPGVLVKLLAALAILTMTAGNVLGLLQYNVKRLLAYSSIAHSGYMLVGVTALAAGQRAGLAAVLFYLAAYGIMNAGAFGVLMLLPGREPGSSAETFKDLAGQGRHHVGLGLAMAVSCLSLIGLPLTVGFIGKVMLVRAAFSGGMVVLALAAVINAAISAAYYLGIIAAMFLRPTASGASEAPAAPAQNAVPIQLAVGLSVAGTLLLGAVAPAADTLAALAQASTQLESPHPHHRVGAGGAAVVPSGESAAGD